MQIGATTESRNPRTQNLDELSIDELLATMNAEDARVPAAVAAALPAIGRAVRAASDALRAGGARRLGALRPGGLVRRPPVGRVENRCQGGLVELDQR